MTIENTAANTIISGSANADYIYNDGSEATIIAGAGNDDVTNYFNATLSHVDLGDGNDTVWNYSGYNYLVGGDGSDTIVNVGRACYIDAGDGNDMIQSSGKETTILGGDGSDFIIATLGSDAYIGGGAGNDSIQNSGRSATIAGGAGDELIVNTSQGDDVLIEGGAGDEGIVNYAYNVTIAGGVEMISYTEGDGNDTVYGATGKTLIDFDYDEAVMSDDGADFIFKVGEGSVNFKNYFINEASDPLEAILEPEPLEEIGELDQEPAFVASKFNKVISAADKSRHRSPKK